jgi:hypothetical protein
MNKIKLKSSDFGKLKVEPLFKDDNTRIVQKIVQNVAYVPRKKL